jgi:hypothetical protein
MKIGISLGNTFFRLAKGPSETNLSCRDLMANERALATTNGTSNKNGNSKRGDKAAPKNRSGSKRSSSDSTHKDNKQKDLRGFFGRK